MERHVYESETLHTGEVQRHKGKIKYTGHS